MPTAGVSTDSDTIAESSGYGILEAAGIDTAAGLRYCRDDAAFYESMLLEFAKSHDAKNTARQQAFESENWADYAIYVHAVKSTAKMIGAAKLSDGAKELEEAGKKEDSARILMDHEAFESDYGHVCEAIRQVVSDKASEDEDDILEFGPMDNEQEPDVKLPGTEEDEVLEFAPEGETDV